MDTTQTTLRETIEGAVDAVMTQDEGAITGAPDAAPAAAAAPDAAPAPKGAEQPRREDGTFAKKPKDSAAAPQAAAQKPAPSAPAPQPAAAAEPAKPAHQMPKSWKKELEPHWGTLVPEVQAAIVKRDEDYSRGVLTYKGEWDRAKPVLDALGPFMPDLERHRIDPAQFVANLASAHRTLALGTPEQKLSMFAQLAQQYQIPLEQMFVRGQDGQVYLQPPQAAPQPQQQGLTPQAVEQLVRQQLAEQSTTQEVAQFQAAKDAAGNPAHPHFEAVKDTMAGLLQAGLAEDLAGAYEAALRHPRHAEIFEAIQRQQREADEAKAAAERAKNVTRARHNAISTPSSTPTGTAAAASGKKGLRAQLEENLDAAMASRV